MNVHAGTGLRRSLTGAALFAMMVLVMWAWAPSGNCAMPPEGDRHLVLTRDVDREHLARDLGAAARVVQRHEAAFSEADEQQSRSRTCETALFEEIAARHGLTSSLVRATANRESSTAPPF